MEKQEESQEKEMKNTEDRNNYWKGREYSRAKFEEEKSPQSMRALTR